MGEVGTKECQVHSMWTTKTSGLASDDTICLQQPKKSNLKKGDSQQGKQRGHSSKNSESGDK